MKKFKKSVAKKLKKSNRSDARNSSPSRTESLKSTESFDRTDSASLSSAVSNHPSDELVERQNNEARLHRVLQEWDNAYGKTWSFLEIAEERIALINDLKSWQPTTRQRDELEEEFSGWENAINKTMNFGKRLCQSEEIGTEYRKVIVNNMQQLDEKWTSLREMRDRSVVTRAQHQLEDQDKLENWKKDVETTMVWIREKQRELESMDDLESSLHMLEDAAFKIESLYSEISNYQEKIDGVVQVGVKFIQDEEKDTASTPSIQSDIRSLEDTWELLREKCTAIQLSIQERMLVKQSEEREYMAEWHETCTKIDDWLTNAENQVALFAKARELICDVEDQVAEHEELVFRLATEEKTISDHLEAGEILSQQKIRQQDNKLRVKTELKALKKRRNKLNARLVGQQESLTSYLDHLTRIETEEFEAWLEKNNAVKKSLSELDKEEHNKSIDSVDEARISIAAEEAFIAEIEGFQSDVDEVVDNAQSLIADGKMGKLRRQTMRSAIKLLEELYEEKRRAAATRLREVSEELLHLQHQEEEKISSWMNKVEILHKWIEDEHKQLDTTLTKENDDDDYTIESIMQEEYAAREIKSSIASRSTAFESLMNEGERLKCNNTTERYHTEKHAQITELIPVTGNKWNALNTAVNNKLERVASMLSAKQGQLLSICSDQILDLEKLLSAQGPVSDGFDTLVKDCEFISDFLGMVGQAKANMINFNKFAKTMLESVDVANVNKFEIREASEMLQARLNGIEDNSDERKALLHDKIIDVMTEAMVALSDTVGNLEDKYVEINVPDNLDTVDLVERNMNLEDILRRLVACDVSLTDIEILGKAAESCLILETGEGDDITKEIQHRRVFINHVQQLTREKKSRLYGLLVYTFKQRIEEFDKNLTSIEANSQEDGTGMSTDLKTVIERTKNVETSMEQLEVTQKNSDEISMQINDMVDESVLAASDEEEIKILSSKLAEHFPETSESLKSNINGLKQLLKAAVMENLTELQDYLTMMERRREGDDNIGPDSMTIRKQISEMNIVECQMKEKRLTPLLHYEDEIATTYLDSNILFAMKEADRDWLHLSDWMAHRTKVLLSTQEVWEAFRQEEVDLLDMLRDKEKQIKNFEPVNLEEKESVANRLTQLKDMLTDMEEHKDDVSKLHKVADDVIELIGQSSPMSNNIKSQVDDIHDCWNNTVRQIIEAISKLNCAKEMLQNMEAGINEVREWLQSTKSILQFYTNDSPDDMIEDLKPQVMEKCDQEPEKRTTLSKVNSMSRELLDDLDGASCDIMHGDIQVLNNDYDNVIKDLEKKKKMKKRPCYGWCYRRPSFIWLDYMGLGKFGRIPEPNGNKHEEESKIQDIEVKMINSAE
eukprot:gene431-1072_t